MALGRRRFQKRLLAARHSSRAAASSKRVLKSSSSLVVVADKVASHDFDFLKVENPRKSLGPFGSKGSEMHVAPA
jgi:hypothetical protein